MGEWDGFTAASTSSGTGNAWDGFTSSVKAAAGNTAGAALGVGSKALELLARPGQAMQATMAGPDGTKNAAQHQAELADFKRGWDALIHGSTPEQIQSRRDAIKTGVGLKDVIDKIPEHLPGADKVPGWLPGGGLYTSVSPRGLADAGVDLVADPTTYAGGLGLIEKGANTLGRGAFISSAKGLKKLEEVAPKTSQAMQQGVAFVTPGGSKMGKLKLQLAADEGRAGLDKYALARSIQKGTLQNTQGGIERELAAMEEKAVRGLKAADQDAVYEAVDKGTIAKLSPELQKRATALDQVYKSLRHLEGAGTVRKDLAKSGFDLPEELQPFDTSVRGIQKRSQVRQNYLPHGTNAELGKTVEAAQDLSADSVFGLEPKWKNPAAKGFDSTKIDDAHLKARDSKSGLQDAGIQRAINQKRIAMGAKAIGAKDAQRDLAREFAESRNVLKRVPAEKPDTGEIYRMAQSGLSAEEKRAVNMLQQGAKPADVSARIGIPITKNLIDRAQTVIDAVEGNFSTVGDTFVDTGRKIHRFDDVPGNIKAAFKETPKHEFGDARDPAMELLRKGTRGTTAALFFDPFPHAGNVTQAALLSNPGAALKGLGRYAASGEWIPAEGVRKKVQFLPPVKAAKESQDRALTAARKSGSIDVNPERAIPGLINAVPGLKQVYGASNRVLWGADDALKATLDDSWTEAFKKAGHSEKMAGAKAADRVGQDMVDYGDTSDLNNALKTVLPFATYATKKPGIVARAIARHPERVLAMTRDNPNFQNDQKAEGFDSGRPLMSIFNAANNRSGGSHAKAPFPGAQYLRASVGAPIRDALATLNPYFAYRGRPLSAEEWTKLLATQVASPLPGGNFALDKTGLNYFGSR